MSPAAGPVWVAAVGDANDGATASGTPFHCLEAGRAARTMTGGLPLATRGASWRARRVAWNLGRLVATGGHGGFQFTDAFLDRLWRQAGDARRSVVVLNFFQLFPAAWSPPAAGPRWFYIDQTLTQLFEGYGLADTVPAAERRDAVSRERDQYLAADGVVCQSAWAAASVTGDYGVPADRVHVVLPGANLPRRTLVGWEAGAGARRSTRPRSRGALRLVFVGKDWRRKGLDRLLRGMAIARACGVRIELAVIGVDRARLPAALARTHGVAWHGLVDKAADPAGFIRTLASADVGCLLSRAEAGGIALREFGRLGLPTIAPAVGGAPEYVAEGAATLIAPDTPDAVIADALLRLATDADGLAAQRAAAWRQRHLFDWRVSVAALSAILSPTGR